MARRRARILTRRPAAGGPAAVIGMAALAFAAVAPLVARLAATGEQLRVASVRLARLERLTTTGTAGLAALSADGRYVAHVVSNERGRGIWLRQVATSSNVEIVPPAEVRFAALAFSPDGNYVLYVAYPQGQNVASLFQVPVLGGGTRQLLYDIDSAPAFSPDGHGFAFVRGIDTATAIMVANADGGSVRQLATRTAPLRSSWAAERGLVTRRAMLAVAGFDRSTLTARLALIDAASGMERRSATVNGASCAAGLAARRQRVPGKRARSGRREQFAPTVGTELSGRRRPPAHHRSQQLFGRELVSRWPDAGHGSRGRALVDLGERRRLRRRARGSPRAQARTMACRGWPGRRMAVCSMRPRPAATRTSGS